MKSLSILLCIVGFLALITVNVSQSENAKQSETPPGQNSAAGKSLNEPPGQPGDGSDARPASSDDSEKEDPGEEKQADGENKADNNVAESQPASESQDGQGQKSILPGPDGDGFDLNSDERLVIYQKVFMEKRQRHLSAVEDMMTSYDYEQQYKLVNMVFDKMQEMYSQSRKTLTEYGFEPGMPFPGGEAKGELLEALSVLLENVAFLSDIVLRLPDISTAVYNKNRPFRDLAKWAIKFVGDTKFFDEVHSKLLSLLSQELRIVKRDADFVNPFRRETEPADYEESGSQVKKKKAKPAKKRGPRMSRQEL